MTQSGELTVHKTITAEVSFPTLGVLEYTPYMEMTRADLEVDTARTMIYPTGIGKDGSWLKHLTANVPASIGWRSGTQRGVFNGYVTDIATEDTGRTINLKLSGVGYPLMWNSGRSALMGTMQHALELVARSNYLSYATGRSASASGNLVQGSKSDWEWLAEMADRENRSLHMRGGTIVAHSLDHMLSTNVNPFIEVVIPDPSTPLVKTASRNPVRNFRVSQSNLSTDGWRVDSAQRYPTMTASGGVTEVSSGPGRSEIHIGSPSSPDLIRNRSGNRHERWSTRATLVMDGVVGVYPMDLVRTVTASSGVRSLWSVLSITHKVGHGDDSVEMELGKEEGESVNVLLNRPTGQVSAAMWNATDDLGQQRWYSDVGLRYLTPPTPGRKIMSELNNRVWASEVAG